MSEEIIKVLDALCEKFGIAVDWTSVNVVPYLEQLGEKFIKWEIATSIGWIAIMLISVIVSFVFSKLVDMDGVETFIFWGIVIITVVVIGVQAFDIIECCTFPEKNNL